MALLETTPVQLVLVVPQQDADDGMNGHGRAWSVVESTLQGLVDRQASWLVMPFASWADARSCLIELLARIPDQTMQPPA